MKPMKLSEQSISRFLEQGTGFSKRYSEKDDGLKIGRRGAIKLGFAGTAGLLASAQLAAATGPQTFLLIHGAFHGGWCWSRVADALRAKGHRVFTPSLTGLGDRAHLLNGSIDLNSHVEDALAVIESDELKDVVLVGHSFAGFTITGVADRMPEAIKHLFYLDAAIALSGRSPIADTPPKVWEERLKLATMVNGVPVFASPPPAYFGVTDPKDAQWMLRHLKPMPVKLYETALPLKGPPGNKLPRTFVRLTQPPLPQIDAYAKHAKGNGWKYTELAAPHDVMVTDPEKLADLLESAS